MRVEDVVRDVGLDKVRAVGSPALLDDGQRRVHDQDREGTPEDEAKQAVGGEPGDGAA